MAECFKVALVQNRAGADEHFSNLAAELGIWIQPGSVAVEMPTGKLRNRAVMLDAAVSVGRASG